MNRRWILIVSWLIVLGEAAASAWADDPKWPSAALKAGDFGGEARVTRAQLRRFLPPPKPHPFNDGDKHRIRQLNGEKEAAPLPANIQWISKPWNGEIASLPYLVYMPEKDRVLMLVGLCGQSRYSAFISSDDHGKTWSPRQWLSIDKAGKPNAFALGLTYFGQGELVCYSTDMAVRWLSSDYGRTWRQTAVKASPEARNYWDPLLVFRGANGRIERVAQGWWKPAGGAAFGSAGSGYGSATPYSQAYFRSSADQGQTWSDDVKVPQWAGVNEVDMIVAANGDWVAACRIEVPERFVRTALDDYGGLAISISKNEGKTWSDLRILYDWGRHHPCMVLLPDGRILMSYIVRMGYPSTTAGLPQYGVDAVLSSDNGQTWDLEHRYSLATWVGTIGAANAMFYLGAPQSSSTVVLPDGMILTAFATGFRNCPEDTGAKWKPEKWKSDVMLVKWRMKGQTPGAK